MKLNVQNHHVFYLCFDKYNILEILFIFLLNNKKLFYNTNNIIFILMQFIHSYLHGELR